MQPSPLSVDLEEIVAQTANLWTGVRGARIFLTGGTGFFGIWLVESFLQANRALHLDAQVVLLTRNESAFFEKHPHLAGASELSFHRGDVRDFDFPSGGFSHVISAATEASAKLNRERPNIMRDVIVTGTRRTLDFAASRGVKRFLLVSSGAVYGRQRPQTTHITEEDSGASAPFLSPDAYAEGKREAENLCLAANGRGLETTIARGFAFVGPHLPLDAHFAIGNFIRDGLHGGPISIGGDGTPYRSYLYAADLAVWLWTILLNGTPGRAYNVGSERRISIAELARLVATEIAPDAAIHIAKEPTIGKPVEQYVPSTVRARMELGLRETVSLEEAVKRTAAWGRR